MGGAAECSRKKHEARKMKRARSGAARGVSILLATILLCGTVAGVAPANGQAVAGASDSGRQVTAQLGRTSGVERYRILYDLKAAKRIATGLTAADLNAIIVGMEDERVKVVNLMSRDLVPNLTAADVVASGGTAGAAPASGAAPLPVPPPGPGVLGGCGSTKWQRLAVPEYVCFSMYGGTLPWVSVCSVSLLTGYTPVYLGEACRTHDACYGGAGARKSQCDASFRDLLIATCEASLQGAIWEIGRRNCRNVASEYYHQVTNNGRSAFIQAQAGAGTTNPTCQ
jgi:hypothetical protein